MAKQKTLTKQQEIIQKHVVNPFTTMPNEWHKSMGKMMDEYAIAILDWLGDKEYDFSNFYIDSEDILNKFKEDKKVTNE